MSVVVRFAPAALFNWLFARRYKGKFILRLDDTDRGPDKTMIRTCCGQEFARHERFL